jgi:hypothetical protein
MLGYCGLIRTVSVQLNHELGFWEQVGVKVAKAHFTAMHHLKILLRRLFYKKN